MANNGSKNGHASTLRVMTYNIHHGRGRDGKIDLHRIAHVIKSISPDLVALQEVDYITNRSGRVDQGLVIAEVLRMEHAVGHNWFMGEGAYGNVFMSRFPLKRIQNIDLSFSRCEPRGCLVTTVQANGKTMRVGTLHLGLAKAERGHQCGRLFLDEPFDLLLGDFNSFPFSRTSRLIRQSYLDAFSERGRGKGSTFQKFRLGLRLDYIYCGPAWTPLDCWVERSGESALASDHFPLVADLAERAVSPDKTASETDMAESAQTEDRPDPAGMSPS
jgi:endonuclease/exonuclease/phosphatase family metal-dependent hydrolase